MHVHAYVGMRICMRARMRGVDDACGTLRANQLSEAAGVERQEVLAFCPFWNSHLGEAAAIDR